MQVKFLSLTAVCALSGPLLAAEINTSKLTENGWYSDDTRADGTGSNPAGTNLVSDTLTDLPEQGSGSPAANADILSQIIFGVAPGTVPAGTHEGAVHLLIGPSGSGKSQISHRNTSPGGHGPGSGFGPGFMAEYSWMANGTISVTASLKFGIQTAEFGMTGISSRTGENAWDKVLIYEPGNLNGGTADGLWHTETITHTSGTWWFFDRTAGAGIIGTPMTLSAMSTSGVLVGGGPKTVADVYALITAPGAIITSVQFGIGSGNAGGSVYVNELTTNVYRSGDTTTFGTPSPYDQDVTPDVIFGAGNANGSYTVDRTNGIELGMRGKLRYPASNIFNSNGDGTYTFRTGTGGGPAGNSEWAYEFAVNTNFDGSAPARKVGDLTYQIGLDNDPGPGTDYLVFDPISIGTIIPYTVPVGPIPYWDHSMGDNSTPNGGGVEAANGPTYAGYLTTYNVAQNSWRPIFYQNTAPYVWNPNVVGRYEYYLAAFDGAERVARTAITIYALDDVTLSLEGAECQTEDADQVTPGNQIAVTLHLRNPDGDDVTGYQAFLAFDDSVMTFVGATSSYSAAPFTLHFQPMATAEVAPGEIRLDGSLPFLAPPVTDDFLLATLHFTVASCVDASVEFDLTQAFDSEASFNGVPITTDLIDSPTIVSDTVPPVIGPVSDITQPADAGSCTEAVVYYTDPTVMDVCDPMPSLICSPPSGSTFPVGTTTVTCIATDSCGNQSMSTFDVTITATNLIDVVVELQGSGPAMRCIHFKTDTCVEHDEVLSFVGMAPAVAIATIEVPCGVYTHLCAKDEQHTKWDTVTLSISMDGSRYVADADHFLAAGDTDNDGDVDINDVTLLLAQFGMPAAPGGCPWDGTRNADFSNNGVIGSEDYSILSGGGSWLTTSMCVCTIPAEGRDRRPLSRSVAVRDAVTDAADLNRDGRVDVLDVEELERRHNLSGELSMRLRQAW